MKYHELKTVTPEFQAIQDGSKRFEFRKDDRGFEVGDVLILRETTNMNPAPGAELYTCRVILATVVHKLPGSNPPDTRCIFLSNVRPPS